MNTFGTRPKFLGSRYIEREFGGKPCPYCNRPMIVGTKTRPTKDHVKPKSQRGTLEDCIIACLDCNQKKGDMSVEEFRAIITTPQERT